MKFYIREMEFVVNLCSRNLIVSALSFSIAILLLIFITSTPSIIISDFYFFRISLSLFYLIFIPGILILLILKIKLEDFTETVLFSTGLSISSIMFLIAIYNILSLHLGFEKPISETPLAILLTIFTFSLCAICYLGSKNFSITFRFKVHLLSMLLLWLLPLSLFGSYWFITNNDNIFLILLYLIISTIPLLATFNKVPKESYSLVIWIITLSLLIPRYYSLNYVAETIMPGVVTRYNYWDPSLSSTGHNSLLFNTIVHPTFFFICGFENILIELKTVVPLISSLIPLALYQMCKKRMDELSAFLCSLLFVFFFWFYATSSPRQIQAEFFLALILLSTFNDKINSKNKVLLSIIFAFSLITSHYGTSYLFMVSLIFFILIVLLCKILGMYYSITLFNLRFFYLYVIATLAWYIYTSGSLGFMTLVGFYKFFFEHMRELLNPEYSHALGSLTKSWNSLSIEILKYLTIAIVGLIAIGVLSMFRNKFKEGKLDEYTTLSVSFLLVLGTTLLPIGGGFDTSRIFHITLLLLSPFSVIGLKEILKRFINQLANKCPNIFAGLLIVFFLLNCGFIAEFIPNDYSPNAYINKEKIIASNNILAKYLLYRDYYIPNQDIQASEWIQRYGRTDTKLYCDGLSIGRLTASKFGKLPEEIKESLPKIVSLSEKVKLEKESYIFLAYHNNIENLVFVIKSDVISAFSLDKLPLKDISITYNNGYSIVGKT